MWQKINLQRLKIIIKNYLKNWAIDCTKCEKIMQNATFSSKNVRYKKFLIRF